MTIDDLFKPVIDLNFGKYDASNYDEPEFIDLFQKIYLETKYVKNILEPGKYFLVGEKGTGKTALAFYLSNSENETYSAHLTKMGLSDYKMFVNLKKNNLIITDYEGIWKTMLLLLVTQTIIYKKKGDVAFFDRYSKLKKLEKLISDFYQNGFKPEITNTLSIVSHLKSDAKLRTEFIDLGGEESETITKNETNFQTTLMGLERKFIHLLSQIELNKNLIIFIDGLDQRQDVSKSDHMECLRGLTNAVWTLNKDVFNKWFPKSRIRIVLLLRPDIFVKIGMHNTGTRSRDNSVLLSWNVDIENFFFTDIFQVADRLLSSQQIGKFDLGKCWQHYFPFIPGTYKIGYKEFHDDKSFKPFLRLSLFRPRDIIAMLGIVKSNYTNEGRIATNCFQTSDLTNSNFRRQYAEYLLSEILDYFKLYYSDNDFRHFLNFFKHFNGRHTFNYAEFNGAFQSFLDDTIRKRITDVPDIFDDSDSLLQFLFELNIVGYIENSFNGVPLTRFYYREKNMINLNPEIRLKSRYQFHLGFAKGLSIG